MEEVERSDASVALRARVQREVRVTGLEDSRAATTID
jgi:hypothetical protein